MMLLFLHVTCSCTTMHCFFFFFFFPEPLFYYVSILFLFPSLASDYAPKKYVPSKNPITRHGSSSFLLLLLLFPLFVLEIGPMIQNPKRILMRTLMIGRFTRNTMSFHLIFQTLLYPEHLPLRVRNLFVRNPRGVLTCLYRNSTSTYTLSIPMFLNLLQYSKEHIS